MEDSALMSSFCFETLFFPHVHHQYTVHSNNLLPWFLSWMWKYWLLVSFWVTGGLGRVTARCGGRDIFCNGEIFYFTIFLSPAFSGLLGDSGTKKERGGGERGGKGRLLQTNAFGSIPPL